MEWKFHYMTRVYEFGLEIFNGGNSENKLLILSQISYQNKAQPIFQGVFIPKHFVFQNLIIASATKKTDVIEK